VTQSPYQPRRPLVDSESHRQKYEAIYQIQQLINQQKVREFEQKIFEADLANAEKRLRKQQQRQRDLERCKTVLHAYEFVKDNPAIYDMAKDFLRMAKDLLEKYPDLLDRVKDIIRRTGVLEPPALRTDHRQDSQQTGPTSSSRRGVHVSRCLHCGKNGSTYTSEFKGDRLIGRIYCYFCMTDDYCEG
jgi:hypothetical protein